MTKIVLISDTHGYHDKIQCPEADILIHAGDCTDDIGQKALREFLTWFERQPAPIKILIAGNHDGAFQKWPNLARAMVKEIAPSVFYLENSGVTIKPMTDGTPVKIWGSPYTPAFMNWFFNSERGEDIKRHWDLIPDDTDILVTHGPPFGFLDKSRNWNQATGRRFDDCFGCRDLRDALYRVRPRLHVFGHIHGSGGVSSYVDDGGHKTVLVNASIMDEAYIPCRKPIVIELP